MKADIFYIVKFSNLTLEKPGVRNAYPCSRSSLTVDKIYSFIDSRPPAPLSIQVQGSLDKMGIR